MPWECFIIYWNLLIQKLLIMSGNFITLDQAKSYTKKYRDQLKEMLTTEYQGALSYCETFDADAVRTLLDQKGCVGFRVYYGLNNDNQVCAIMVGVNDKNEDILNGYDSVILDNSTKCPKVCPPELL